MFKNFPATQRVQIEHFSVIAYPKSGQTWLRVLLGRYFQGLLNLPDIPLFDGGEPLQVSGRHLSIEFTHSPLTWSTQTASDLSLQNTVDPYRDHRAILMTRYPLDVQVSLFMQHKFQVSGDDRFTGTLESFIEDKVFGLDKLVRFHQLWASATNRGMLPMFMRYEDLLAAPQWQVQRLLSALGVRCQNDVLQEAVDYAAFDSMKAMQASENVPRYKSSGFAIFGDVKLDDPRSHHVRRGGIGNYRDDLPPDILRRAESRISHDMPAIFGYQTPPERRQASRAA